jgi:hypothetical protein
MKRVLWGGIAACLLLAVSVVAATGQFVSVDIESFRSWGVLRWGSWDPMDVRLLSARFISLPATQAAELASARAACSAAFDKTQADLGACQTLESIRFRRETTYDLQALLGRPYRIRFRNLTAGHIGLVVAIDGLNTLGNEPVSGDASDRKWILRPFQEVTLSGWQISATEALQFQFATPSRSHSALDALRGVIQVCVYPADPYATEGQRGTQAGPTVGQTTVVIPFASATTLPVETVRFDYSRDRVLLGIQCEETAGAGLRVAAVVDGTAAQLAGLRTGDIITYVNAIPVNSCADLQSFLSTKRAGDRVVVKVHRPDRVFLMTIELEE